MEQYQIDQNIRLKNLVKALNLNQSIFAKSLDMAQPNISRMMGGKSQVSVELLNRISIVYKTVNLHWLITGDGPMFLGDVDHSSPLVQEDPVVYEKGKWVELEARLGRLEKTVTLLEAHLQIKPE